MESVKIKNKMMTYDCPSIEKALKMITETSFPENKVHVRELLSLLRSHKYIRQERLDCFVGLLETSKEYQNSIKSLISQLCHDKEFTTILTDADLILDQAFLGELFRRIGQKILPLFTEEESIERIFQDFFYQNGDDQWIATLNDDSLVQLIKILHIDVDDIFGPGSKVTVQLNEAMQILMVKIGTIGIDKNILKMVADVPKEKNPFLILQYTIDKKLFSSNTQDKQSFEHIETLIIPCQNFINKAYQNVSVNGINYSVHLQMLLLEKLLERLSMIINLLNQYTGQTPSQKLVYLFKMLLSLSHSQSKIGEYVNKSTQIYAKEITRNIALKGENYITTDKTQYWNLLKKALGGGAIVAFACLIKMKMGSWDISLFAKAISYSINYSVAFTSIYLLHQSLATKQPAMTAAALAKQIEEDMAKKSNFVQLSETVSQVWRSQFIAFVGNVLMVMPVALLLIFLYSSVIGENAATPKVDGLIHDLIIFETPVILHSAIAGVFLFVSGLIAGSVANKIKTEKIPERIRRHPFLLAWIGQRRTESLANFVDQYWAGMISNIWFGFFMGCVGIIGSIVGLDIDIRHITFAAGNFMLALYGSDFSLELHQIVMGLAGIGIIGFINFIVSFSLSMSLALRARGIRFDQLDDVIIAIKNKFIAEPFSFFYPTQNKNKPKVK
jgi:site-specific recombinase